MIWALIFAILLTLLGGGSPFVVPKLDNYVKKHVVDDVRKKEVLSLLKASKKQRKATLKKDKKLLKKLHKYSKSRTTSQEDYDRLYEEVLESDTKSQNTNIKSNQESQKIITAEEWNAIVKDIAKNLEKTKKKRMKSLKKQKKKYLKWKNKIQKSIADVEKRKKTLEAVDELQAIYLKNYNITQAELMDINSALYQYRASREDISALQKKFTKLIKEVYETNVSTHFKLVELTTPEEWKKIM